MRIAVVGATGMVGEIMLKVLAERNFPVTELIPVASEKSIGKDSKVSWVTLLSSPFIAHQANIHLETNSVNARSLLSLFLNHIILWPVVDEASPWASSTGGTLMKTDMRLYATDL